MLAVVLATAVTGQVLKATELDTVPALVISWSVGLAVAVPGLIAMRRWERNRNH